MTTSVCPDKGDIVWMVLEPRVGHEQAGRRPVLVISERLFNERTALAIICPITSKVKGLPFEVLLKGTQTQGVVLPIHVRSVDWNGRHAKFIERAPRDVVEVVCEAARQIISY